MSVDRDEMIPLLRAVLDGQKAVVSTVRNLADRQEETRASLVQITRQQGLLLDGIRGLVDGIRGLETRADATHRRLEDIENALDAGFKRTHELQNDLMTQENQILNSLDASITNGANISDVEDRIERIEIKLGIR